jgi:hypothetical protein
MSLTEFTIRAAKPREKPHKLADSGGLYLLVQPGGSRLWRMKYRVNGKEKSLAFGSYPQVSLAKAREARGKAKDMLAEGKDPSVEKQREVAMAAIVRRQTFASSPRSSLSTLRGRVWRPPPCASIGGS